MLWKIPFNEHFKSERTQITEISAENAPKVESVVENVVKGLSNRQLSEEQLAVINRFPTRLDSMDKNWNKMEELVNNWKNKTEIWPLAHNMKLISLANGLSAFYTTHAFRRAFKLADGRTAVLNSYIPALALPLFFGSVIHYRLITAPIAAGVDRCRICQCLTAGLIQSLSSTLYPLIYSSISSIYFADYFNTFPTPDSIKDEISRKYLYDVWFKAIKRNKTGLISIAILNFLFAFYLTDRQQNTIELMYFTLLNQEYMKTMINK